MNVHSTTRQKGLRNRTRDGRGTYSLMGKRARADRYNTYESGKVTIKRERWEHAKTEED